MIATLVLLAAIAQAPAAGLAKADPDLDAMKAAAGSYRFARGGEADKPLRLLADPAFRMGKQSADVGVEEGAIFLWVDDVGRPEAAAQVFRVRNAGAPGGLWVHEFTSLSTGPLLGVRGFRPGWSPRSPGVEFRPIPGAPRPDASAARRSAQMKALAREFKASDHFKDESWVELRLLTTPVARYGKPGSAVEDGALFAFATGTDPEAFLFLEARAGAAGLEWQYAFAPMTCYELKGTHGGRPAWEVPYRKDAKNPFRPYFVTTE